MTEIYFLLIENINTSTQKTTKQFVSVICQQRNEIKMFELKEQNGFLLKASHLNKFTAGEKKTPFYLKDSEMLHL